MDALFASGRVVDLILLLMAGEAALLVFLHATRRVGMPARQLIPNLLAGACLLMALRAALTGAGAASCAMWLLLGLGGHLLDLAVRWPGRRRW
jgi:hypothetical protein